MGWGKVVGWGSRVGNINSVISCRDHIGAGGARGDGRQERKAKRGYNKT